MTVRFAEDRGRWFVDTTWPDARRTRTDMPDEATAKRINKKIEVAIVDEERVWKALRQSLNLERDGGSSFSNVVELYRKRYVAVRNRNLRTKESRLRILERHFGSTPISAIDRLQIDQFVAKRLGDDEVGNRTVNRDLRVLLHLLSWAVEMEYVSRNQVANYPLLEEVEWVGERPDEGKIERVFAQLAPTVVPIFTFIRETGCRRGEAISLKRSQLDFARGEVVFHGNTKNGRARSVPLTDAALWSVEAMPRIVGSVFYHPDHLRRWTGDALALFWEKARKAAECEWMRIHDLRHAYAIKLAEQGVPMHYISAVLGHYSTEFTRKVYARFSPDSASRAVLVALQGGRSVQAISGSGRGEARSAASA